MNTATCKFAILFLALAVAPAEERQQTFAWFSGLGYPDVKGKTFVRVATGHSDHEEGAPPRLVYVHGFLLDDQGKAFQVLTPDLETRTYEKTGPDVAADKRVGYEPTDLAQWVAALVKNLDELAKAEEPDPWRRFGSPLTERAEVFVTAWACWRQGLNGPAHDLYDRAAKMAVNQRGRRDQRVQTFGQRLADDFAHTDTWRLIKDFGDAKVSRAKLLVRCQRHLTNFPESGYLERVKETAALLKQMVQEDVDHAEQRKTGKPFEQLTKKEQIADLVFQLRDQNGRQWSQPGSCDVFATDFADLLERKKPSSPAHRLVEYGYEAVPQLIEALDDKRFTRSVGFHRDFYFSHHVLRVGDAAVQILARIAGRSFYVARSTSGTMSKDDQTKAVKDAVQAWYATLQQRGEKHVLVEATQRGDWDSPEQVKRLVDKYPDAALPAIAAGLRAASSDEVRMALLEAAHKLKGEEVLTLLREQVKDGATLATRLCAAQILHLRGQPEGVAAMIKEWQKDPPPSTSSQSKSDELIEAGLSQVAALLAASGNVEAITALGKDWQRRPVRLRTAAIAAFGHGRSLYSLFAFTDSALEPGDGDVRKQPPPARAVIEQLLIAALEDTEEATHVGDAWNDRDLNDPRICDLAGHVLNELAPDKYPFDVSVSLLERDRALVQLRNIARQAKGLPPQPVPEIIAISPVPEEKLRPLVDQLLKSTAEDRPLRQGAIEELGLGALPGIQKHLESKDLTEAERALLEEQAQRLACLVTEVVFAPKSAKPNDALVAKLNAMKTKPFDGQRFIETISSLVQETPKGVRGFRFIAFRLVDQRGFTIKVDLLDERRAAQVDLGSSSSPGASAPKDRPYSWRMRESVTAGRRSLHGMWGSASDWGARGYPELAKILMEARKAKVRERIRIEIDLIGDWAK